MSVVTAHLKSKFYTKLLCSLISFIQNDHSEIGTDQTFLYTKSVLSVGPTVLDDKKLF